METGAIRNLAVFRKFTTESVKTGLKTGGSHKDGVRNAAPAEMSTMSKNRGTKPEKMDNFSNFPVAYPGGSGYNDIGTLPEKLLPQGINLFYGILLHMAIVF